MEFELVDTVKLVDKIWHQRITHHSHKLNLLNIKASPLVACLFIPMNMH